MLINHSLIYLLSKIIPGLFAFLTLSIYSHLLTPEEYGVYTLLLSVAVYVHNILIDWLSDSTLRFWSNERFAHGTFIKTIIYILIRLFVFLFIISIVLVFYFWGTTKVSWIVYGSLLVVSLGLFTITQTLSNVKIKPLNYAFTTISYSIFSLVFGTLLAYLGYGPLGIIVGITLGTAISSLITIKQTWGSNESSHFDKALLKKLFSFGIPIAIITCIEELVFLSDKLMITFIQGVQHTGLYAVSYDLSHNSILMIMTAINLAAYPVITNLIEQKDSAVVTDYINNYLVLLLGVSIPSLIGLNLVGEELINFLIDERYHESTIIILPWISGATFLLGLQFFYFDLSFQLSNKTLLRLKITIVVLIVNLISNYIFISIWGIKGAAMATLLSFAVGNLFSIYFGRNCYSLPFPLNDFIKILVSSVIMVLVVNFLKQVDGILGLVLQISLGIATYFLAAYSLNIHDLKAKIQI